MADIVLKDRNGNPVEYPGVEKIKVNTVDGEVVEFVDSTTIPEMVENIPVVLDFSGGDQTINAPDGMAVKSAIIQKPETLTPENIAKGVNIAGVIGALLSGGAGKVVTGFFAEDHTANVTVEHGLGVLPDVVCTFNTGLLMETRLFQLTISKAFASKIGVTGFFCFASVNKSNYVQTYSGSNGEDNTLDGNSGINATDATITFKAASTLKIAAGTYWFAIGGLT